VRETGRMRGLEDEGAFGMWPCVLTRWSRPVWRSPCVAIRFWVTKQYELWTHAAYLRLTK